MDHSRNVADLARAAAGLAHSLDVLIGFDAGQHRTEFTQLVRAEPRLRLRGLQAYAGHLQHIVERERRAEAAADA